MDIMFYHIDAFTGRVFSGNPAGVCFLDAWVDDQILQSIAAENNLPETAFLCSQAIIMSCVHIWNNKYMNKR